MPSSSSTAENPTEIAERIASGEYFREAMHAYHLRYHDVMVERYFYGLIAGISLVILLTAILAANAFLPLKSEVAFIYNTADIVDDLPLLKRLGTRGQDYNLLVKQYLVENYVRLREEYNAPFLERSANGIRAQSSPEVYAEYEQRMDPQNAGSPISLYQRHSVRGIQVLSTTPVRGKDEMEVVFDAYVNGPAGLQRTRHVANIAFRFPEITLDEDTGEFSPLEFTVTRYQSRKLQDS